MNNTPPGEETFLQTSIDAITRILQRKMFSESKDEIALILFGTPDTDNPLADGECYENITIAQPMDVASFELIGPSCQFNAGSKRGSWSDLGGEFGDDQIDTVVAGIKNSGTELNVIGPSIEEDDDDEDAPGPSTANGHTKDKTPQQRAGEAMLKHILQEVDGECYSFSEALPALSYFQTRQIRQTAWKCQLEITSNLKIPVCSYVKVG
ncbi:XRCC5 [Mytilus coruscus]|uniref:XRCC5 n=1 Tax=Mytilus coruscus TaxID=42192 RepID=A0A6J8BKH9_MYTCO|nr:XRCC5 [Mytilus coruscus]